MVTRVAMVKSQLLKLPPRKVRAFSWTALEGLLKEVFGLVPIACHAEQIPQHAVPIPADQLAKGRRITPQVSGD